MLMRMTSDDPKYIDIEMMDWIQAAAKNIGAELCSKGGEGLCDELYDNLQYGVECSDGVIA